MYEQYLYKQQLLDAFGKDNEMVDNVKLQLREKIINKLKTTQSIQQPPTDATLLKKICNTLLLQYLEQQRYFHTMAVFSPESGYAKHHFSRQEMGGLLQVRAEKEESMLQGMVKECMPRGRMVSKKAETGMQTDDREIVQNLQNRLSEVEFGFKQKMLVGIKNVQDSEARYLKYKNELNKRFKTDLDAEINRVRNFQIANIRMEEQQKHRVKLRQLQQELEMSYRTKMQKLRERETEVIQRVTTKMKEVETYNYQARQRVLKDMEIMRAKEEELDRLREQLESRQRHLISKQ